MKSLFFPLLLSVMVLFSACKAKKPPVVVPPAPPYPTEDPAPRTAPVQQQPAPVAPPAPPPPMDPAPAPAPDYNFSNILFEFNSAVLKTSAYPELDKAVAAMKTDPSVKFVLNGYASAEGTEAHNTELSAQRASAVKTYLVNSGVAASSLKAKGYGDSNPVSANTDEASRALNRRVEIKKQ